MTLAPAASISGRRTGRFDPLAADAHRPAFMHGLAVEDARRAQDNRRTGGSAATRAASSAATPAPLRQGRRRGDRKQQGNRHHSLTSHS